MTQQIINVGTSPNSATGDPLRTAFQKCNSNFTDLYTFLGAGSGIINAPSGNAAITLTTPLYTFGNATDNPNFTFAGSGSVTMPRITGPTSVSGGTFTTRGLADNATGNVLTLSGAGATAQLQGEGPLAVALVDMTPDSGSFTGTPTGGTGYSPATVTVTWRRMGNLVAMTIPATTGTSNAVTFTITGSIPSALIPATSKWISVGVMLNAGVSTTFNTSVNIATGVLSFAIGASAGVWQNSGTKGIASAIGFAYSLD